MLSAPVSSVPNYDMYAHACRACREEVKYKHEAQHSEVALTSLSLRLTSPRPEALFPFPNALSVHQGFTLCLVFAHSKSVSGSVIIYLCVDRIVT